VAGKAFPPAQSSISGAGRWFHVWPRHGPILVVVVIPARSSGADRGGVPASFMFIRDAAQACSTCGNIRWCISRAFFDNPSDACGRSTNSVEGSASPTAVVGGVLALCDRPYTIHRTRSARAGASPRSDLDRARWQFPGLVVGVALSLGPGFGEFPAGSTAPSGSWRWAFHRAPSFPDTVKALSTFVPADSTAKLEEGGPGVPAARACSVTIRTVVLPLARPRCARRDDAFVRAGDP